MGTFNMELLGKIVKTAIQAGQAVSTADTAGHMEGTGKTEETIILAPASRTVEDNAYGNNDTVYHISFQVNGSFKEAKSHSAEVEMLYTYAPGDACGEEGVYPYLAVQMDYKVYNAVQNFKETGTFPGAMGLIPLSGTFYFKAKMEYYEYLMYFYGLDRCDGSWENNGLCIVYPKKYAGTENEKKLMKVLDTAAESYQETRN